MLNRSDNIFHGQKVDGFDDEDWQTSLHKCQARSLGRRIWQTQDPDPGKDFQCDDEHDDNDDGDDDDD